MSASATRRLAWAGILLYAAAHLAFAGLRLAFDAFDADELNQAHLAWLVASGKVLYRDFWDNHGPVFALLNGGLLALLRPEPGTSLLFWCRAEVAAATLALLALTWRLARLLGLRPAAAATAVAILCSLLIVQDKGTECRPDSLQNVFWYGGLCLLAASLARRRAALLLLAGACFGVAVLTNTKAALGPFFVFLFYVAAAAGRWQGLAPARAAADLGLMLAGGLPAYGLALAYFGAHGAIADFHVYNVLVNLTFVAGDTATGRGAAFLAFFATEQAPFATLALAGIALWLLDLRGPGGELARPAAGMLAVVAVGYSFGWALNNYGQFYLMLLPAWSIVAAHGLWAGAARLARAAPAAAPWAVAAAVAAGAAAMTSAAWRETPRAESDMLRFQRSFTASMLAGTARDEPIGVVWDICGGFMFNEPVQRYWALDPSVGRVVEKLTGRDPFGEDLVRALEERQVRFITGRDGVMFPQLPAATQRYVREHYRYGNCLWTRRREPAAAP